MRISVFGSASTVSSDPLHEDSFILGKLLALKGYEVITGGYMGTMERVSQGACENGGHTIGVTCQEIENWRNTKANPYVKEIWHTQSLTDRLELLTKECDGAIALPGGIGTLVEINLMWNQMVIQKFPPKPLIIIGDNWKKVFNTLFSAQEKNIPEANRKLLIFTDNVNSAVLLLGNLINDKS